MTKNPSDYPIQYLESIIDGFENVRKEYDAEHIQIPLEKTSELLELFRIGDTKGIAEYYMQNKNVGEKLGSGFYQVLCCVEGYLNKDT